jgi:hypothetical protein
MSRGCNFPEDTVPTVELLGFNDLMKLMLAVVRATKAGRRSVIFMVK